MPASESNLLCLLLEKCYHWVLGIISYGKNARRNKGPAKNVLAFICQACWQMKYEMTTADGPVSPISLEISESDQRVFVLSLGLHLLWAFHFMSLFFFGQCKTGSAEDVMEDHGAWFKYLFTSERQQLSLISLLKNLHPPALLSSS